MVVHAFEPSVPAVTPPHTKIPVAPPLTEKAETVRSPGVVLLTLTVLVLGVEEIPEVALAQVPVPIAVFRLVAKVLVRLLVMKVPVNVGADPVQVVDPFVPAVAVFQRKRPEELPPVENGDVVVVPGVVSVTVTVFVLGVAVIPAPAGQRPIAVAMLEAKVVVLLLGANVPVVELEQALVLGAAIEEPLTASLALPVWLRDTVPAVVLTR